MYSLSLKCYTVFPKYFNNYRLQHDIFHIGSGSILKLLYRTEGWYWKSPLSALFIGYQYLPSCQIRWTRIVILASSWIYTTVDLAFSNQVISIQCINYVQRKISYIWGVSQLHVTGNPDSWYTCHATLSFKYSENNV